MANFFICGVVPFLLGGEESIPLPNVAGASVGQCKMHFDGIPSDCPDLQAYFGIPDEGPSQVSIGRAITAFRDQVHAKSNDSAVVVFERTADLALAKTGAGDGVVQLFALLCFFALFGHIFSWCPVLLLFLIFRLLLKSTVLVFTHFKVFGFVFVATRALDSVSGGLWAIISAVGRSDRARPSCIFLLPFTILGKALPMLGLIKLTLLLMLKTPLLVSLSFRPLITRFASLSLNMCKALPTSTIPMTTLRG